MDNAGPASGLFANTSNTSTNQSGDISITTGQLSIQDRAEVTVSSEGLGDAGSIIVEADSIFLDSQGRLGGETRSGTGANITLLVEDLILIRNGSVISTTAFNQGNGGNITINAPFLIAVPSEDSDVIANAFEGNGGRIEITTSGIYGLAFREELTSLSDINASSEFGVDGIVAINRPDIDLVKG